MMPIPFTQGVVSSLALGNELGRANGTGPVVSVLFEKFLFHQEKRCTSPLEIDKG
jgi:hypothetical protein